jgi:hypothetical protein
MASTAAVAQAEAMRYAIHFAELHNAIDSGDLGRARKALSEFQRDSALATARGFDPVNGTSSLRSEFASIRRALQKGDIQTAQSALSNLRREMLEREMGFPDQRDSVEQTLSVHSSAPESAELVDAVSVVQSGILKDVSSTFIQRQPALVSFTQGPQVFPTSGASNFELSAPSVSTSTQAVLQGPGATQWYADTYSVDGTAFAPTPELLLGSTGMSIPDGAQLQFADSPLSLRMPSFLGS